MPGRIQFHSKVYLFALTLLAAGLPLSIWFTSLAEVILVLNWLIEWNFKQKWQTFKKRKSLWFIISLYILHIAGLIFTTDFAYALHDLKIKLPVLLLPLILGTSPPLSYKDIRIILLVFSGATLTGTLVSMAVFTGVYPYHYNDIREISIFISHIRFSMMIVFSVFILAYLSFAAKEQNPYSLPVKVIFILTILWLIFFLTLMKSITGLMILIVIMLFITFRYLWHARTSVPLPILRTILILIPILFMASLAMNTGRYFQMEKQDFSALEKYTLYGNPYYHDTTATWFENGHLVWLYISEKELEKGWNEHSNYDYQGMDDRGQEIKFTLMRYMTSRGLRKDLDGINQLRQEDINAIEKGLTNYIFLDKFRLYPRIYEIIWEADRYLKDNKPGGHSVAQRILYLKAALEIFSEHVFFGTGTGDLQNEFNRFYSENHPELETRWRLRAHNQYITFLLSFGLIGFPVAILAFLIPPFIEKRWTNFYLQIFMIIVLMSFLTEDTLETQTGVSFVMFFYALFVFGKIKGKN